MMGQLLACNFCIRAEHTESSLVNPGQLGEGRLHAYDQVVGGNRIIGFGLEHCLIKF